MKDRKKKEAKDLEKFAKKEVKKLEKKRKEVIKKIIKEFAKALIDALNGNYQARVVNFDTESVDPSRK